MAEQGIGLAADGPGKKVHAFENTVTVGGVATVVEDQAVCLVDQFGVPLVGQKAAAASRPVVIASDQIPLGAALADGAANPTTALLGSATELFNGATWDRARGNLNTTTGDIGTKTTSFAGATQTNYNARGAIIAVYLAAVSGTSPTMACQFQIALDAGSQWVSVGSPAANMTGSGQFVFFVVYPTNFSLGGATPAALAITGATATVALNMPMPRTWRINYTIGGTSPSFALSGVQVGYIL